MKRFQVTTLFRSSALRMQAPLSHGIAWRSAVSPICNRQGFRTFKRVGFSHDPQNAILRYSAARASRNQKPNRKIIKEFQGFLPTEKSSRNETIPSDDALPIFCATNAGATVPRHCLALGCIADL